MADDIEAMKAKAQAFVETLQDEICAALEAHEPEARFREDLWQREGGGGGRTRVLAGEVFEKAGVNTSAVFGELEPDFASKLQGEGTTFFATGISLVLHPTNPHLPTTHANWRYIVQGEDAWFGGGADLTPYYLYDEDAAGFHAALKAGCDAHDASYYPDFKARCDAYFHLPHRGEHRGVGGIFYDGLKPGEGPGMGKSLEDLFAFMRSSGNSFLSAYLPIVERRKDTPYTEAQRAWQLHRRGRYVEFNLVYDRGTLFGLKTGGRIESILMSLPPVVHFPYAPTPDGPEEERLLDVVKNARDWA